MGWMDGDEDCSNDATVRIVSSPTVDSKKLNPSVEGGEFSFCSYCAEGLMMSNEYWTYEMFYIATGEKYTPPPIFYENIPVKMPDQFRWVLRGFIAGPQFRKTVEDAFDKITSMDHYGACEEIICSRELKLRYGKTTLTFPWHQIDDTEKKQDALNVVGSSNKIFRKKSFYVFAILLLIVAAASIAIALGSSHSIVGNETLQNIIASIIFTVGLTAFIGQFGYFKKERK